MGGKMIARRKFTWLILVVGLAGLITAGMVSAGKASGRAEPEVVMAPAGPGFTFQGQLDENEVPVQGSCDFRARLWDAAGGGAPIGSTQTVSNVAVAEGRFTITLNGNGEFGGEAFTGSARWLEIAVRCPAGSGSYTTLQPRQSLTAAPYAHSLVPGAIITGSVGGPTNAMLSLGNLDPNGVGLRIFDTSLDGLYVDRAGRNGVYVGQTGDDGFFVCNAGGLLQDCIPSASRNGLEVGLAAENGLLVSHAGSNGIEITNAGDNGIEIGNANFGIHMVNANYGVRIDTVSNRGLHVGQSGVGVEILDTEVGLYVGNATSDGLWVLSAGDNGLTVDHSVNAFWAHSPTADGLYVFSAGYNGVDVTGANLAGYFGGAVQITGGCTGCLLATFGINVGDTALEPGDVVVVRGMRPSASDSVPVLLDVARAEGERGAIAGVVLGRAEMITEDEVRPGESGRRLIPREGPAPAGEYVTIAYSGLVLVKADPDLADLHIGDLLTAGPAGSVRALGMVEVEGIPVAEAAPTLGIALEAGDPDGDGLIWVLMGGPQ